MTANKINGMSETAGAVQEEPFHPNDKERSHMDAFWSKVIKATGSVGVVAFLLYVVLNNIFRKNTWGQALHLTRCENVNCKA